MYSQGDVWAVPIVFGRPALCRMLGRSSGSWGSKGLPKGFRLGFRVWGLGFRVQGFGVRVQGFGVRV